MSSNPHGKPGRAWSLRARLLLGQIVVLVIACVGIAVVTEVALHQYLMAQLDHELYKSAHRSAGVYGPSPPGWHHRHPHPRPGPGPDFLDIPGQRAGMVAAVVRDGTVVNSGYLTGEGARAVLTPSAVAELAACAEDQNPVTVDLEGLGRYRVVAGYPRHPAAEGDVLVTGLPMADVDDAMVRVLMIFGLVTLVAVAAATTAGIVIIRRALEPLRRVAQTAAEVVDLPLSHGEVALPVRVAESDANPATEVGQLGSALNRMLDHIGAALSARQASETRVRQFVADASHELRTPLAAIRGYAELAQRVRKDGGADESDGSEDAVAYALSRVESETRRMTHLVEDLLLLARLDSGRPLRREPVDLSALAVDAVSDAHVAGPDQHWRLELPDEPVIVVGDPARLHQVLANLLANARVHTGPGTEVTTQLRTEATQAVLTVTDDGPGIPEPLQVEVFERFARGDSSRSRKDGSTGLGLAIASAVIKAHQGTITVQSRPGCTAFAVRLPWTETTDQTTAPR